MGNSSDELRNAALSYHRLPRPGKFEIQATKPLGNQRDLALAYTPGVAAACEVIAADPAQAASLTIRSNHVGWRLPGGRWVTSRLLARLAPGLGGSLICAARRSADLPSPRVAAPPNGE